MTSTVVRERQVAQARRLPSLTGLRFIAAAMVFLCHTTVFQVFAAPGLNDRLSYLLVRAGTTGVEFFFILSGFVLTWSAKPGDSARSFWWRRAMKIYPNNLVGCGLALVGLVVTNQVIDLATTARNVFLVQSWWPDQLVVAGINVPTWSLACEVLFYLLFPLLLPVIRRVPGKWLWPLAAGIVLLVFLLPSVAGLLPGRGPLITGVPFLRYWFVYVFPVSRLLDFALGIVLARIVRDGLWRQPPVVVAVAFVVSAYLVTLVVPLLYAVDASMLVPLAVLIGAVATTDLRGGASIMRGRFAVWLGEVSFAFYTLHYLVLTYGTQALGRPKLGIPAGIGLLAALFAVTVLLAAVLYRGVERPVVRAARRTSPTLER